MPGSMSMQLLKNALKGSFAVCLSALPGLLAFMTAGHHSYTNTTEVYSLRHVDLMTGLRVSYNNNDPTNGYCFGDSMHRIFYTSRATGV